MSKPRVDTTNFEQLLEFVEGFAPTHPMLPTLRSGYSMLNARYLANAVEAIYKAQAEAEAAQEAQEEAQNEPILTEPANEVERALINKLRKLFGERAAQSNRFHQCHTQAERAAVSDEIGIIQKNIALGMQRLRYYRLNGRLPDEMGLSEYEPKDGMELVAKRNSIRCSISIKKADIKRDSELDQEDPRVQQRMANHKTKLKQLETALKHVQNQIDSLQRAGV